MKDEHSMKQLKSIRPSQFYLEDLIRRNQENKSDSKQEVDIIEMLLNPGKMLI